MGAGHMHVSPHMRALLLCGLLSFAVQVSAWGAEQGEPAQNKWPKTVAEAVTDIVGGMSEEDKQLVRQTSKKDLISFHLGWGMGIRNNYGLWRGNRDLLTSACGKPCHPDDASMIIIEAVWAELRR